jgi:hypothetical protein
MILAHAIPVTVGLPELQQLRPAFICFLAVFALLLIVVNGKKRS